MPSGRTDVAGTVIRKRSSRRRRSHTTTTSNRSRGSRNVDRSLDGVGGGLLRSRSGHTATSSRSRDIDGSLDGVGSRLVRSGWDTGVIVERRTKAQHRRPRVRSTHVIAVERHVLMLQESVNGIVTKGNSGV